VRTAVVLALAALPAAATAQQLVLAPLPRFRAARASEATARADLDAGLTRALRRAVAAAQLQTSALAGRRQHLRSDAFVFGDATIARTVLGAWAHVHHALAVSIGGGGFEFADRHGSITTAEVAWHHSARIGVVVLASSKRAQHPRALAREYAGLADGPLRTPLPTTAWGRVLAQIRPNGTVSEQTALAAFAVAYGGLPGVKPPSERRTTIESGTQASEWIRPYIHRLSQRRQRIIDERLGLPLPDQAAHAADYDDPGFHQDAETQSLADDAIIAYQPLLGHAMTMKVVAGQTTTNDPVYADTLAFDQHGGATGKPVLCRIRLTPVGQSQSLPFQRLVIAHEVFHCFQYDMRTSPWTPMPAWITEGTADWAALTIVPVTWETGGGNVKVYIGSPGTPLFQRSYDAVGFWGHVQDTVPGLFNRFAAIFNATSSYTAFSATGASSSTFLDSWGSSFLRYPGGLGGIPWHMFSPIVPPDLSQLATPADTINGSGLASAPAGATAVYVVNAPAGEPLEHIAMQGWGRLSPVNNYLESDLRDSWFCTDAGGCMCPPGDTSEIPAYHLLGPHTALALSGDPSDPAGSFADLTSYSLDHFCHPKASPHQGATGVSNGDPYLTTFDGGGYGFQAAGEFTLVKSTVDDLEIQSRQVPYPERVLGSLGHQVLALNTAFAVRDGAETVEIDKGSPLALYIDKHRRRPRAGQTIRLRGGGRVRYGSKQTIVTWRDGTRARVFSIGDEGVNLATRPARKRAGLLRGLFGNDNGRVDDDFVGRGGRSYPHSAILHVGLFGGPKHSEHVDYRQFGQTWRVQRGHSLFVYPPGKHFGSYTILSFPHKIIWPGLLGRRTRRRAQAACRRAHVTNANLLAGCTLDVGATGDRIFASTTGTLQHDAGIPGSGTQGQPTGPATSDIGWAELSPEPETHAAVPAIESVGGGQAVIAYARNSDQSIVATTFGAGSHGITGVTKTVPFAHWQTIQNPVLLPKPGGGAQVILDGVHSGNTDPLNGTVIVPRNADGSFGTPTNLSASQCCITSATLAADGTTPIWLNAFGNELVVTSGATEHDETSAAPAPPYQPVLGRDHIGRLWLAWYSWSGTHDGLYMMRLDPQTGAALGSAQLAPDSDLGVNEIYAPTPIACAQTCRLLYANEIGGSEKLVSWAPGESQPTEVAPGIIAGHPQSQEGIVGAYTSDGRLWVAWTDAETTREWATLGDARGHGGPPIEVELRPHGFVTPGQNAAVAIGERLLLATDWGNHAGQTTVWATAVNPPR
jgi:hypothetical protein